MDGVSQERQERTPLVSSLGEQAGRVSFHMPGHRDGRLLPAYSKDRFISLDMTELEGTGDLAAPSGQVLQAYQLAARFFGAGESWFISSGTSASLFIALASALREGDKLILPRAVHLAVVHALGVLGLEPLFVRPEPGRVFPDGQPDPEAFIQTIRQEADARACFVTCPDYYGRTLDLSRIAREAHKRGMVLIVDEAHGAHFAAAPGLLPETALSQGADLVCQSAHKTLPALTPASLLHLSQGALDQGRVEPGRLAHMVKVFQTSSPSFLIAATLDAARSLAATRGEEALARLIGLNEDLARRLPASIHRLLPAGADPSRLVLDFAGTGLDRRQFSLLLDRAGIDAELIDFSRAVFIPGFDQVAEDYDRLHRTLREAGGQAGKGDLDRQLERVRALTRKRDRYLSAPPQFSLSVRQALFGRPPRGKGGEEDLSRSVIAPYPPGFPLLWPGEVIRAEHRSFLEELKMEGLVIRGVP